MSMALATETDTRAGASDLRAVRREPLASDFLVRAAEAGVHLPRQVSSGRLLVDLTSYLATLDDEELGLSARQLELLALFLAAPGRVWSRRQLHWVCWGDTSTSRRVDVQLCRLRSRTGMDLFRNVRDRGWALRTVG